MPKGTARIEVGGLRLSARVGVTDAELESERVIVVDIEVVTGRPAAAETDSIDDTIDYAALAALAREIAAERPHRTLERLAARISEQVGERFEGVEESSVRVRKPDPPIDGEADFVAVTLFG